MSLLILGLVHFSSNSNSQSNLKLNVAPKPRTASVLTRASESLRETQTIQSTAAVVNLCHNQANKVEYYNDIDLLKRSSQKVF